MTPLLALTFADTVEDVGRAVDAAGVVAIVVGVVVATVLAAHDLAGARRSPPSDDVHGETVRRYRRRLGRAILVGLEILVAADIIRTVAVSPTFHNVGVLAGIVAIRTFLSLSLEVEIDGRWPWRRQRAAEG